jgi:class 3 adenylate cyclase
VTDTLTSARAAAERHAWSEVLDLMGEADAAEALSPEGLELLGHAAWWTSDIDACIDARERAYAGYMERGDTARAGLVCLSLAEDYFHRLAESVGSGWMSRAERLLGENPEAPEYGWLARTQAVIAYEGEGDIEGALELARVAYETGIRFGDRDLQALSLHDQGRIMLADGRISEGLGFMDEAMVSAVGGELEPIVTGRIYCNMIDACERLADYRRANEWDKEARRWCDRVGHKSGFPGICRVKRAEIMRLRGAWKEAEAEARRACSELSGFLDFAGRGFREIGEIRLRIGDFSGAEEAFRRAHELGQNPQPGLALLRLAQGDAGSAGELIAPALDDAQLPLDRARLLPARVEIALAAEDVEIASQAAAELRSIADEFRSEALSAAAEQALGLVALHEAEVAEAVECLNRARKLWSEADLPYEAGRARLALGLAYRASGTEELAQLEIEAARSVFERLGAKPDEKRAGELLDPAQDELPQTRSRKALMFTDIVGSTNLIEAIGDEAWTHLVRWHDRMLRARFSEHGGDENDHAGDGFFVVFPTPSAAIECAIDIQKSLHQHRTESGFAPEVRVGVHYAEVTEVEGAHTGVEIHKAARIAALAEAGEILGTIEAAAELPESQVAARRSVSVKGIADPVEIVTILWR